MKRLRLTHEASTVSGSSMDAPGHSQVEQFLMCQQHLFTGHSRIANLAIIRVLSTKISRAADFSLYCQGEFQISGSIHTCVSSGQEALNPISRVCDIKVNMFYKRPLNII